MSIDNGLLLRGKRIVIPQQLLKETLEKTQCPSEHETMPSVVVDSCVVAQDHPPAGADDH